ncbi:MAG: hypothetical protein KatS3mg093_379 [Candidatus Parcubacteria bacterium]|nr:MAG: hypothetical protein KatS3mg093_379 [Candidatus Parcubacteria bacterium]
MRLIPLHDFDEANRAEAAKNMSEFKFYLAPLTGSPFWRNENLKMPLKENPNLSLYPHLERPPLYFWLMIVSTKIFGNNEFAYRLPSFIFGLLTISYFLIFSLPYSAIAILTSSDLWLSSQSALMDTTLTFFLFLAFLFLLKSLENKNGKYSFLSGIFWGLAILSKGQPAVIFAFPLLYLLLTKRISLKNLIQITAAAFLTVLPWLYLTINKFGFNNFVEGFLNFAKARAVIEDTTQKAPFFWYLRWWFESARIALILFSSLLIYDLLNKKVDQERKIILAYFIPSFLLFSLARNKVWWYVLPLIPIIVYYIDLSAKQFLKKNKNKALNLSLITFISSLPVFYNQRNILALILFGLYVLISYLILTLEINLNKTLNKLLTFSLLILPLIIFLFKFPKVNPTYPEVKKIGEYYKKLPQPKCLYIKNMPYESALFYTDAKEVNYLDPKTSLPKNCQNYLLTPDQERYQLIFEYKRLKLYKLN